MGVGPGAEVFGEDAPFAVGAGGGGVKGVALGEVGFSLSYGQVVYVVYEYLFPFFPTNVHHERPVGGNDIKDGADNGVGAADYPAHSFDRGVEHDDLIRPKAEAAEISLKLALGD
jgi:hypothetical protein